MHLFILESQGNNVTHHSHEPPLVLDTRNGLYSVEFSFDVDGVLCVTECELILMVFDAGCSIGIVNIAVRAICKRLNAPDVINGKFVRYLPSCVRFKMISWLLYEVFIHFEFTSEAGILMTNSLNFGPPLLGILQNVNE